MDELKININTIGKGKDNYEIVDSCSGPFNRCMIRIVNNGWNKIQQFKHDPKIDSFVKRQETIDSFERLRNNIALAKSELPHIIIARCFPHFIKAGEHIIKKNADHFLKRNYAALIKEDDNKTMIYDVINLIVKCFDRLEEDEREEIWELANIMLICCIAFKKHIKQTGEMYGQDPNAV